MFHQSILECNEALKKIYINVEQLKIDALLHRDRKHGNRLFISAGYESWPFKMTEDVLYKWTGH